ncbi:hypothetical protein GGE68_003210 [Rhizobium leguminosarum]|nr:hypothetical protein [Rhizobium leguminosarum]
MVFSGRAIQSVITCRPRNNCHLSP